jgi:hypothetical protein
MFDLDRLGDDLYSMDSDRINHVPARHPGLGHDPSDKKPIKIGGHVIIGNDDSTHPKVGTGIGTSGNAADQGTYQPPVITSTGETKLAAKELHARNGKLEKSFVSFAMNHPHWRAPRDGARYLSSLAAEVQQHQLAALTRRQRIYGTHTSPPTTPGGGVASGSILLSPPPQPTLERTTSDENDDTSTGEGDQRGTGSNNASVDLSQSDRHLISSFTDLLAMAGSTGIVPSSTGDLSNVPRGTPSAGGIGGRYAPHTPSSLPRVGGRVPQVIRRPANMASSSMTLSQSLTGANNYNDDTTAPLPVDLALSTGAGYLVQADVTQPQSMWSQDQGGVGVHPHTHGASAMAGGLLADAALAPPNVFALMERSVDLALNAKQTAALQQQQQPIATSAAAAPPGDVTITMGAQRSALPGAFRAPLLDNDHSILPSGGGVAGGPSYQQPLLSSTRPIHVGHAPLSSLSRQRQGSSGNISGMNMVAAPSSTSTARRDSNSGTGASPSFSSTPPRRPPVVMNLLPLGDEPSTTTAVTTTTSGGHAPLRIDAPSRTSTTANPSNADLHNFFGPAV